MGCFDSGWYNVVTGCVVIRFLKIVPKLLIKLDPRTDWKRALGHETKKI